jgi:vancomycin permeability regulator SanA
VSAVVILSSGPVAPGRDGRTAARTRAGVKLYLTLSSAEDEPRLVLSGGKGAGERVSKAEGMKEIALDEGVPPNAILLEERSGSTLQNALFSRQALGGDVPGHVVIVTDRFHIPRAWASFRWAGMNDLILVAADGEDEPVDWDNLMGEAVKWPVNIARAAAFSALSAAGWSKHDLLWMLE